MTQQAPHQDETRDDGADADQVAPAHSRRVWPILISMFVLNVFAYATIAGTLQVLLPTQVRRIAGDGAPSALALVTGVAAIASFAVPPLVGILSDRTGGRWGRRTPWIFFGGLGTAASLVLLGAVHAVVGLVIGWFLMQAMVNIGLNVILATIPDRIPRHRHGLASTVQGLGLPLGAVVGVQTGAYFVHSIQVGYVLFAVMVALASAVSAWLTRETAGTTTRPARADRKLSAELLRTFDSLRNRDYRWVFVSRSVLYLGVSMVGSFGLYIMQDYIHLPAGLTAVRAVATTSSIGLVLTVVGTLVAGPLVDRFGHHRRFVLVSSLLVTVSMVVPFLWPTWYAQLVSGSISGFAMGLYLGVDMALATLVMPKGGDTGRDLGVFHIALTAPQVIAPFFAARIVTAVCGYGPLFLISGAVGLTGALAVLRVRRSALTTTEKREGNA